MKRTRFRKRRSESEHRKWLKRFRLVGQLLEPRRLLAGDSNVSLVSMSAPSFLPTSAAFEASWTIGNDFDAPITSFLQDRWYLSSDETLDAADRSISDWNYSGLPAGSDGSLSTITGAFVLPSVEEGDYFFLLEINANEAIGETNRGDNVLSSPLRVGIPDLMSSSLRAPDEAVLGQTIQLGWTVENDSDVAAVASWTDRVFLSEDTLLDATDVVVGGASSFAVVPVDAGQTYSQSISVDLPAFATGDQFLVLSIDVGGAQRESDTTNNTRFLPISLAAPDLVLSNLVAPSTSAAGATVDVGWTVTNPSDHDAEARWSEQVWYSNDDVLDSSDRRVFSWTRAPDDRIAAGEADVQVHNIRLPDDATGSSFLIFEMDPENRQGETDETNNRSVHPIQIDSPDLAVTDAGGPSSAIAGETIEVNWTVVNTGLAAATGDWFDAVYVSADSQWSDDDVRLSQQPHSLNGDLAVGDGYSQTIDVGLVGDVLPVGPSFLLFVTDDTRQVSESDEGANVLAHPLLIRSADLIVSELMVPQTADRGDTIDVSWTVTNVGDAATNADWSDYLAITADQDLSCEGDACFDFPLGVVEAAEPLPLQPGQSYVQTVSLTVPTNTTPGAMFVGVRTDSSGNGMQAESDESNNERYTPILIDAPATDLVVTRWSVPTNAKLGDTIDIEVTVTNDGQTPAGGSGFGWRDDVVLASDQTGSLDRRTLATRNFTDVPLLPDQSYSYTISVEIPRDVADGPKYLLLMTDATNRQLETDESNNVAMSAIDLLAPNLKPTRLDAPSDVLIGEPFVVEWAVQNASEVSIVGEWSDEIYLSFDEVLDDQDHLLVRAPSSDVSPLGVGDDYLRQRTLFIDQAGATERFLILATDVDGQLREQDEIDNQLIVPVEIRGPDLKAGSLDLPATAVSGEAFAASWTVVNEGDVTVDGWIDEIVVTRSGEDDATVVVAFPFSGSLAPGESVRRTQGVVVPVEIGGSMTVAVHVDRGEQLTELNESNNRLEGNAAVELIRPLTANLIVRDVVLPRTHASLSEDFEVQFVVENVGEAGTSFPYWGDTAYLSPDDVLDDGDRRLGRVVNRSALGVGEAYVSSIRSTLTGISAGDYYVLVETDSNSTRGFHGNRIVEVDGEDDNVAVGARVRITVPASPDLITDNLIVPANVFSGQTATIRWRSVNQGDSTAEGPWRSEVYLSDDDQFDPGDRLVGHVDFETQYQVHRHTSYEGPYSDCFGVDVPDPSTEIVAVLPSLGLAKSAQKWRAESLSEVTLCSADVRVPVVERNVFSIVPMNERLGPGESVEQELQVAMPDGIEGLKRFIILADARDAIEEYAFENNNHVVAGTDTNVLLTPPPDLVVNHVETPATAIAGEMLSLTYLVTNEGASAATTVAWNDKVYLSPDDQFDPESDRLLSRRFIRRRPDENGITLAIEESYQEVLEVKVPVGTEGDWYLFVVADAFETIPEVDRSNNAVGSPVSVTWLPPDLQVTDVQTPLTALAGQSVLVQWVVENLGTGITRPSTWFDRVDIRDTLGRVIASETVRRSSAVEERGAYLATANIEIPPQSRGQIAVTVTADVGEQIAESDEQNNRLGPSQIDIIDEHSDLIVQSGDLVLRDGWISLAWTIENQGSGFAKARSWEDRLIGSSNDVLGDDDDFQLGAVNRTSTLGPNETYRAQRDVVLPLAREGVYYVFVTADVQDRNGEGEDAANNHGLLGTFNTDQLRLRPDLIVSHVEVDESVMAAGSLVNVRWTTVNTGDQIATEERTRAEYEDGVWNESVYLSRDQLFDPLVDRYLGQQRHSIRDFDVVEFQGQTAQQVVTDREFRLPTGLTGLFHVLVVTDRDDQIWEPTLDGRGERNNTSVSELISAEYVSTIDLVAGQVSIPESVAAGGTASLEYSIRNDGSRNIRGYWTDRIYLSTDAVWDESDIDLGISVHGFDRVYEPGESVPTRVQRGLPSLLPGDYHVIVRADIRNVVREVDETNNLSVSLDRFSVTIPELTIGGDASTGGIETTLEAGKPQTFYYQFRAEAGVSVAIDLVGLPIANNARRFSQASVSVRFEGAATATNFDYREDLALLANQNEVESQRLIIPQTQAGTYFVEVRMAQPTETTRLSVERTEISLSEVPFGLFSVAPPRAGNATSTTVTIEASRVDLCTSVELILGGQVVRTGTNLHRLDKTRVQVTFDLRDLAAGDYELRLTNHDGRSATHTWPIANGVGPRLGLSIDGPTRIRPGTNTFFANYGNNGDGNAIAPLMIVRNADTTPFAFGENDLGRSDRVDAELPQVRQRLGIALEGDAGLLPPGFLSSVPVYTQNELEGGDFEVKLIEATDPAPLDLDAMQDYFRPFGMAESDWTPLWQKLQPMIGSTWGSYVRALAETATRLSDQGSRTGDVSALASSLLQFAIDSEGTLVHGNLTHAAGCEPVAAAQIVVTDPEGSRTATASDPSGRFQIFVGSEPPSSIRVDAAGKARRVITDLSMQTLASGLHVQLDAESMITGSVHLLETEFNTEPIIVTARVSGTTSIDHVFSTTTVGPEFRLGGLASGHYEVLVSRGGYKSFSTSVDLGDSETVSLGGVDLAPTRSISGRVRSQVDDIRLDELSVGVFAAADLIAAGTLRPDGSYVVDQVPDGDYELRVIGLTQAVSGFAALTVDAAADLTGINIDVYLGSFITGLVTDEQGDVIPNVPVQLMGDQGTDLTVFADALGRYRFAGLGGGNYWIGVPGQNTEAVSIHSTDGQILDVDLVESHSGVLTGVVLDQGRSPVPGVAVRLYRDGQFIIAATTNATGRYTFLLDEPGTFDLFALGDGGTYPLAREVVVDSATTVQRNFQAGIGSLQVVTNGSGVFPRDVSAILYRRFQGALVAVEKSSVGTDARIRFDGLVDGDYEVQLRQQFRVLGRAVVSIEGDLETASVEIAPAVHHRVEVLVSDEFGAPVSDAFVELVQLELGNPTSLRVAGIANRSGSVDLPNVLPATYRRSVFANGFVSSQDIITIAGDDSGRVVMERLSKLGNGRLVDVNGDAIRRGNVQILDDQSIVVAEAVVDAQGNFSIDATRDSGHSVRVVSEGFQGVTMTAMVFADNQPAVFSLRGGATVQGFGDQGVVSRSSADGASFSTPTANLGAATMVLPEGSGPYLLRLPLLLADYYFGDGDFVPDPNAATVDDLDRDDPCGDCRDPLRRAELAIRLAGVQEEIGELLDDDLAYQRGIVTGAFYLELTALYGAIAGVVVAFNGLVAALAPTATAAAGTSGAIGLGTASPGLTVGYESLQILVLAVQRFKSTAASVAASSDSASAAAHANAAVAERETLLQAIAGAISIFSEGLTDTAKATSAVRTGGVGAGGISFIFALRTLVNAVTFTGTFQTIALAREIELRLERFDREYRDAVDRAQLAVDNYNQCSRQDPPCEENTNGPGGGGGGSDDPSPGDRGGGGDRDDYEPILITSLDPNDIVGPEGFGDQNWIGIQSELRYMIRFENVAEATAPARRVFITQRLDPDLDPRTFRVDDLGFSETSIVVGESQSFYRGRQSIGHPDGHVVDVLATVDTIEGVLTWVIELIDPTTGLPPVDALAGFLPPNDDDRRGEGFVAYRIRPRRDAASGTRIDSEAAIIFDDNEAINTPSIFHTLDVTPPVVTDAFVVESGTLDRFTVLFDAFDGDDESGLRDFDVDVAVDGESPQPWLRNASFQSADFIADPGRQYVFTVTATDHAGNHSAPTAGQQINVQIDAPQSYRLAMGRDALLRDDELAVAFDVGIDSDNVILPLKLEFYTSDAAGKRGRQIGSDTFDRQSAVSVGKSLRLPVGREFAAAFVVARLIDAEETVLSVSAPSRVVTDAMLDAAGVSRWQNRVQPKDVNGDGTTTALDALQVINTIRRLGAQSVVLPEDGPVGPSPLVDVNGDGRVTALDALLVINELNRETASFDAPVQPKPLLLQVQAVDEVMAEAVANGLF